MPRAEILSKQAVHTLTQLHAELAREDRSDLRLIAPSGAIPETPDTLRRATGAMTVDDIQAMLAGQRLPPGCSVNAGHKKQMSEKCSAN